ncbi:hypothetical protein H5410_017344 [Solanum commersonii]|uniref:Uncharacterized protein n=1 Tax=Solanum commersonii TaxID=4109 RepID=A0A9J5ZZ63_SOLCO|nr:hypothetical protein H5410_017344 [Solanum commersonii]
MVNQSSKKAKAKKDVPASSKAKVEKQQKKEVERLSLPYLDLHYPVYYGLNKAETGYVSENDDPTRSKSDYTPPTEDDLVNVE